VLTSISDVEDTFDLRGLLTAYKSFYFQAYNCVVELSAYFSIKGPLPYLKECPNFRGVSNSNTVYYVPTGVCRISLREGSILDFIQFHTALNSD